MIVDKKKGNCLYLTVTALTCTKLNISTFYLPCTTEGQSIHTTKGGACNKDRNQPGNRAHLFLSNNLHTKPSSSLSNLRHYTLRNLKKPIMAADLVMLVEVLER